MSTNKITEVSALALYNEVEMDILAAIDMATFLARALDCLPDLDRAEAAGAEYMVNAIRDRMQAVKDAFIEARNGA